MSSSQAVKEGAKHVVRLLEKYPNENFHYLVSFKKTQLNRFKRVAGLPTETTEDQANSTSFKASVGEIKDIINRTSGPLGLQKDLLRKMQAAIPHDNFTEADIREQINALQNIIDNKYQKYYDVGDKLRHPAGNPEYYQTILDEIEGRQKAGILTAIKTIFRTG